MNVSRHKLISYFGKMSNSEKHAFEKESLKDPFLSDALDGYSDNPNAISALKKTLNLGGTILTGIPTGSAPSNDIMIKIAEAYAEDGDKDNAMLWMRKGFVARYDEKPFLKGSSAFKNFSEDEDFLEVFGY